jgi:hypothetical protein
MQTFFVLQNVKSIRFYKECETKKVQRFFSVVYVSFSNGSSFKISNPILQDATALPRPSLYDILTKDYLLQFNRKTLENNIFFKGLEYYCDPEHPEFRTIRLKI